MKRIFLLGSSLLAYVLWSPAQIVDAADAKETYAKECAKCHGDQGKGDGTTLAKVKGKAMDWTNKAAMSKVSDQDLAKIIAEGGAGVGKSKLMPAYKKMDEKAVKEMVSFIRSMGK